MNKKKLTETIKDLHTIKDILRWTFSKFNTSDIYYGHGADNAWDEAVQLVLTSLCLPIDIPEKLLTSRITITERRHIIKLVLRRIKEHIPSAYLTNRSWFCGYEFYVDERVLIPRSPIKELINNYFIGIIDYKPKSILDLCTGSGCIAISCGHKFPETELIDAVDISFDALNVAEKNIINHNLDHLIVPIQSDLFKNIPEIKYNLIITNPPYVNIENIERLPKEFHIEPKIALVTECNGLKLVNRILANASNFLTNNGILICEVGDTMTYLIKNYPEIPFRWLNIKNGGNGIFTLTQQQLIKYHNYFNSYID
ncbi:50S ribosomal protein L3 glutamine methyltransferase [Candidatus Providencia siddallii]|uniref:50S ribosomal protein L3 glutamine methyltransferase n=1 Tax=Candidatus Providencia siddallii TaxID=1715285 RepID=A0A0M6W864_9GAMM|nr:50S ribosomal protein L3 glutamine methyltransferase [Candidatus Providencia siddallii]